MSRRLRNLAIEISALLLLVTLIVPAFAGPHPNTPSNSKGCVFPVASGTSATCTQTVSTNDGLIIDFGSSITAGSNFCSSQGISDSQLNTWTTHCAIAATASNVGIELFLATTTATASGSDVITVTYPANSLSNLAVDFFDFPNTQNFGGFTSTQNTNSGNTGTDPITPSASGVLFGDAYFYDASTTDNCLADSSSKLTYTTPTNALFFSTCFNGSASVDIYNAADWSNATTDTLSWNVNCTGGHCNFVHDSVFVTAIPPATPSSPGPGSTNVGQNCVTCSPQPTPVIDYLSSTPQQLIQPVFSAPMIDSRPFIIIAALFFVLTLGPYLILHKKSKLQELYTIRI